MYLKKTPSAQGRIRLSIVDNYYFGISIPSDKILSVFRIWFKCYTINNVILFNKKLHFKTIYFSSFILQITLYENEVS